MIRPYEEKDLQELLDVWYAAARIAHHFLGEEFLTKERQTIIDKYMPITKTWVFEREGRVVGFTSLLDHEVGALFVHPEEQGRGIGRALLDHVRPLHERLELDVFEENQLGRAFYAKYGFEVVGGSVHEATGRPLLRLCFFS